MLFQEVFLQSQNGDCLEQILSFLACRDLANMARTCKVLQQTIFEADHEEGNVLLIWQGAEEALTNPSDKQSIFTRKNTGKAGSNAREHCHLFALASKAAKMCELSDEIEENRIKVDSFLADLMNVRGYDAEGVAEKKALAATDTRTLEEASEDFEFGRPVPWSMYREGLEASERQSKVKEKWEKLKQLPAPTKTCHYDVFVRITRAATREVISQGFCLLEQNLPWYCGLEWSREYTAGSMPQGMQVFLHFESLKQSEEMQNFIRAYSKYGGRHGDGLVDKCDGIKMTAVVIDRRNYNIRCLFQHDPTQEMRLQNFKMGHGFVRNMNGFDYATQPRWGQDSVQLGPSISAHLWYLRYSLCLFAAKAMDGRTLLVPVLEVNVKQDDSVFFLALQKKAASGFQF